MTNTNNSIQYQYLQRLCESKPPMAKRRTMGAGSHAPIVEEEDISTALLQNHTHLTWELLPSTTTVFYWWDLGAAAQYNHSLLLVDTGSCCPVQPQSSTGGHWELPSTTTVFYWWTLGAAAQYNHSLLLVDTGSCPVQPQSSTGGHWELLPSTTTVFYWGTLGAAQYNHSLPLGDPNSDLVNQCLALRHDGVRSRGRRVGPSSRFFTGFSHSPGIEPATVWNDRTWIDPPFRGVYTQQGQQTNALEGERLQSE